MYNLPSLIYARNVVNLSDESKQIIANGNSIKRRLRHIRRLAAVPISITENFKNS